MSLPPHRILFFGSPSFAVPTLEVLLGQTQCRLSLVFTQPDRPSGRGGKAQPTPIRVLAERSGVPVATPNSIRREAATVRTLLDSHGPYDLGVVIAFGQILPQWLLDYPKYGCVNLHASLLPRWRGAAPMQRALMAGDTESGVSLMQMDAGLDTGAVYVKERLVLPEKATFGWLHDAMASLSASVLLQTLPHLLSHSLTPVPQPEEGATYASKIEKDDARMVWQKNAVALERLIRALSPSPGAFTEIRGKRLKVLEADVVGGRSAQPGMVVEAGVREGLTIQCGEEALALKTVQLEGKRAMKVDEFLRGFKVEVGERLS